jgi:hypothetical protein
LDLDWLESGIAAGATGATNQPLTSSETKTRRGRGREDVVGEGTALLATNTIARDVYGVPVELSKTFFRGDRYRFLTTLKAELR